MFVQLCTYVSVYSHKLKPNVFNGPLYARRDLSCTCLGTGFSRYLDTSAPFNMTLAKKRLTS
jgi:hypothetical protein